MSLQEEKRNSVCSATYGNIPKSFVSLLFRGVVLKGAPYAQAGAIALVDQGIHHALEKSPYKVEFYHEYLDAALSPIRQLIRNFQSSRRGSST